MCYSIQVAQSLKRLLRSLNVVMDYEEAERVFLQRLENPTLNINVSRAFESNFDRPANERELRIKSLISEYRRRQRPLIEAKLTEEQDRLDSNQKKLSVKFTKNAEREVGIAGRAIQRLSQNLDDLTRSEFHPKDERLYPRIYGGFIVRRGDVNVLTPMRYFCRPNGFPASIDGKYPTLYNSRRDNLEGFWRQQFGSHHAIVVMDRFYEFVSRPTADEPKRTVELQFTPQPPQPMLMACIWSPWDGPEGKLNGAAVVTDDPPPEIAAAGHDRCPIALLPEAAERWLTPQGRTPAELQAVLSERQVTFYRNDVAQAA